MDLHRQQQGVLLGQEMHQRIAEQCGRFIFLGLQVCLPRVQNRGLQLRPVDPRVVELVLPGAGRQEPPIGRHRLGMAAHAAGDFGLLVQRRQGLRRLGEELRRTFHLVEGHGQISLFQQAQPDQVRRLPGNAGVAQILVQRLAERLDGAAELLGGQPGWFAACRGRRIPRHKRGLCINGRENAVPHRPCKHGARVGL